MKRFVELYEALDATTSTNAKVEAMRSYFATADSDDAAWAIYFLSGKRMKRLVKRADLKEWLVEVSGYELWMVEECYASVGDFAETVSLLVRHQAAPRPEAMDLSLSGWVEQRLQALGDNDPAKQAQIVKAWWTDLPASMCFIATKLLTGGLRVGVSQLLLAKAIAASSGLPRPVILHRLMGNFVPSAETYEALVDPNTAASDASQPYPFFLASPIEKDPGDLGLRGEWIAEWKWDGIRAQVIRRGGRSYIWSRGEELVTERFPEIEAACASLPDGTVLDGELLAWKDGVLPFSQLQRRLNRKKVSKKLMSEVPIRLVCYDCMEADGLDLRDRPLVERRQRLESLVTDAADASIGLSEIVATETWEELATLRQSARERGVEGLMLKQADSVYETGRKRGSWWKWKIDPYTVDAVLIYAQAGSGRRATLFTDYTFAVWSGKDLLPLAKAYSGLTDKEIARLDRWIRGNTIERFGPVRSVKAEHVFELAFEGINESKRNKSGVAVRFPRILRWREDKRPEDADTLEQVRELLRPDADTSGS
ncbi:ATP-dependent DNA ligase [Pelagicoccus sp. SDUM812002]|uniref:ATP-dependent DNA ligase n=1 Tax=Pelagicoccus sp. SDUM812002 TaxID=3041266 RepID=UPI0028106999|nr:ATP-dependent DNA ligase [Pelagicoccus sp. SDUM812002]MDQ8187963.1 ATP-dependent DNA ligase [Pelagicoccus sp. SDUM812002]